MNKTLRDYNHSVSMIHDVVEEDIVSITSFFSYYKPKHATFKKKKSDVGSMLIFAAAYRTAFTRPTMHNLIRFLNRLVVLNGKTATIREIENRTTLGSIYDAESEEYFTEW